LSDGLLPLHPDEELFLLSLQLHLLLPLPLEALLVGSVGLDQAALHLSLLLYL